MKFDVVVGNPPYQETHRSGDRKTLSINLWSKFWFRSIELTKSNGIVALITPTTWCSPTKDAKQGRLWDVFEQNSAVANIDTVKNYFPAVGSSFGYVVLTKGGKSGLSFIGRKKLDLPFMPMNGAEEVEKKLSLNNNLSKKYTIKRDRENAAIVVAIPTTKAVKMNLIDIVHLGEDPSNEVNYRNNNYIYIHVDNIDEANIIKNKIVQCSDILNKYCRWSGFLNIDIVRFISWNEV